MCAGAHLVSFLLPYHRTAHLFEPAACGAALPNSCSEYEECFCVRYKSVICANLAPAGMGVGVWYCVCEVCLLPLRGCFARLDECCCTPVFLMYFIRARCALHWSSSECCGRLHAHARRTRLVNTCRASWSVLPCPRHRSSLLRVPPLTLGHRPLVP
ncbi:hypothetical protein TRVL_04373 [Trypanosoma vivax]|nr:hypothetical protein TRVL_04373 [Trypanosoma vivax]